ncbi:nucleotide exchange factor GrpE [Natranaerofaba carboxydovora]|uniref:nucleotide exchange factor GrpE n=1 Tax=Natranaerofaba carboxydovora TaxID=2742683 RepID=UPI001F141D9E|nr:nucleotide exchange factor GrpE [Natranaerofaba carboxydovora]UMZ73071.1 GrpE [Natranaerofaba carboxydovora]
MNVDKGTKNDKEKEKENEVSEDYEKEEQEVEELEELEAEEIEEGLLSYEEQEKLIKEKQEYFERLQRLQAEFDNYKKRMSTEREKDKKYGAEDVMKGILPVLDNFERALSNIEENEEKTEENEGFYQGVKMIYDQLVETLEQNGLEKIEAEGEKFDPNYHEAVMMVESEEHSKNTVVEELQKGYLLHDKLLRASMVKVSK